ncbi:MAG: hypothetical protein FWC51_04925 [Proteobacteria bacterium]|nr:hypothetical protein [Pseudomonadota bacterium]
MTETNSLLNFFKFKFGVAPLWMTDAEKDLFRRTVGRAKNYLEFGSGGSTFYALMKTNARVTCVDNYPEWMDYMKKFSKFNRGVKSGRLKLLEIDTGPCRECGNPTDDARREFWPFYSSGVFALPGIRDADVVLIDGRFRVACGLASIKNLNKDAVIMIHDFNDRPQYHKLLDYLDIVESADRLVACRIKGRIDRAQLEQDYEEYKYIVD